MRAGISAAKFICRSHGNRREDGVKSRTRVALAVSALAALAAAASPGAAPATRSEVQPETLAHEREIRVEYADWRLKSIGRVL
jgi:hypothetical protein